MSTFLWCLLSFALGVIATTYFFKWITSTKPFAEAFIAEIVKGMDEVKARKL